MSDSVADHCPVARFDRDGEGFFWLAGQGGYGIMLAAALGRIMRDMMTDGRLSADLAAKGLTESGIDAGSPRRVKSTLIGENLLN